MLNTSSTKYKINNCYSRRSGDDDGDDDDDDDDDEKYESEEM